MATQLTRYRLRFELNPLSHDPMVCKVQLTQPKIWRGTSCYIEVGLTANGTTWIDDFTNIDSIVMDIADPNNRSAGSLVQKTILQAAMTACTNENWDTGGATYYQARFELSSTETNFDMANSTGNLLTLWLVFHVVLTGSLYVTMGATNLTVEEDAAALGVPVLGTQHLNYRITSGGILEWKDQSNGKYYREWYENGVKQILEVNA